MKIYRFLLSLAVGLLALNAGAQNRTVTGTVTDGENGDPVPFASIVVKGTSNWTTTDIDGKYSVEAPSNGVFSVEILGYASQEVAVGGRHGAVHQLEVGFSDIFRACRNRFRPVPAFPEKEYANWVLKYADFPTEKSAPDYIC